jgi:hypothetical protein
MQSVKEAASAFLANKRVAVTGVSRTPKTHGSNNVYKRLRERGYDVYAVNPNAQEVEGDRSYPDLKSIPGGVEAVRRTRHQARVDAPRPRRRQRLRHRDRIRPATRHHRDRRRLPADVRAHRRLGAQDHALRVRRKGAEAGLKPGRRRR